MESVATLMKPFIHKKYISPQLKIYTQKQDELCVVETWYFEKIVAAQWRFNVLCLNMCLCVCVLRYLRHAGRRVTRGQKSQMLNSSGGWMLALYVAQETKKIGA